VRVILATYNSVCIKGKSQILVSNWEFSGLSNLKWCHSNLPQTDPYCHGLIFACYSQNCGSCRMRSGWALPHIRVFKSQKALGECKPPKSYENSSTTFRVTWLTTNGQTLVDTRQRNDVLSTLVLSSSGWHNLSIILINNYHVYNTLQLYRSNKYLRVNWAESAIFWSNCLVLLWRNLVLNNCNCSNTVQCFSEQNMRTLSHAIS